MQGHKTITTVTFIVLCFILYSNNAVASKPEIKDNTFCIKCHGKTYLEPVTERGGTLNLYIDSRHYSRSVHRKMVCIECHIGKSGTDSFRKIPHDIKEREKTECMNCHKKYYINIEHSFKKSQHFKKLGKKMSCVDCHNAHTMAQGDPTLLTKDEIHKSNMTCLGCHTDLVGFKKLSGKEVYSQDLSHDFLPEKEMHYASVRCVECHTPADELNIHMNLPKEKSLKDCSTCHSKNSLIVQRLHTVAGDEYYAGIFLEKGLFDDKKIIKKLATIKLAQKDPIPETDSEGYINRGLFKEKYFTGANRNTHTDSTTGTVILAILIIALLHGAGRAIAFIILKQSKNRLLEEKEIHKIYIRVIHWIHAILIVLMVITGFSMRYGGSKVTLDFAASVCIHNYGAWLLLINFIVFFIMNFITGNIHAYLPERSGFFNRLWRQGRYYTWGIFKGEREPFPLSMKDRLNPLQKITYLPLMYLLIPLMGLSGIFMFFPEMTPEKIFGYNGALFIRSVHFTLAVLTAIFLVVHLYLGTTGARVLSLFKSMITGRHETVVEE